MERKSLDLLIGLAQGLSPSPWYAILLIKRETAQHLKTITIATAFTAKVATLDSVS